MSAELDDLSNLAADLFRIPDPLQLQGSERKENADALSRRVNQATM